MQDLHRAAPWGSPHTTVASIFICPSSLMFFVCFLFSFFFLFSSPSSGSRWVESDEKLNAKSLVKGSWREHRCSIVKRIKNSSILTRSSPGTQGPSVRWRVHTPKDSESLAPGCMEVVVVGDGGHAEAGVVLRSGVCAIAVPGALVQAAIPLLRQFCCFFILTLHTAHYLNSCRKQKGGMWTWMLLSCWVVALKRNHL